MADYGIRPALPSDAEALAAIARHPEVVRHLTVMPTDRAADWAARLPGLGHVFVAAAGPHGQGVAVGLANLKQAGLPRLAHGGEVGLMVHPDWQGRGVGTALMRAVLDLADNWLLLHRLELEVLATNQRAQDLYARLGFAIEGRKREAAVVDGRYVDVLLMARLRPERGR